MQQDKLSNIRGFETEAHDVALAARSPRRVLMHFIGLGVSVFYAIRGELGWRSGESARLPPMWPGFDFQPGVIRALGLLLVLASLPEFSPGFPVFLLLKRTSTSNFQSDRDRRSV